VIVVQEGARGLIRYSPEELQKYIGELTGVRPDIIGTRDISRRPKDEALLVVGGPEANDLVRKAAEAGINTIAGTGLYWESCYIEHIPPEFTLSRRLMGLSPFGRLPDAFAMFTSLSVDIVGEKSVCSQCRVSGYA
jgi:hypothetical protein